MVKKRLLTGLLVLSGLTGCHSVHYKVFAIAKNYCMGSNGILISGSTKLTACCEVGTSYQPVTIGSITMNALQSNTALAATSSCPTGIQQSESGLVSLALNTKTNTNNLLCTIVALGNVNTASLSGLSCNNITGSGGGSVGMITAAGGRNNLLSPAAVAAGVGGGAPGVLNLGVSEGLTNTGVSSGGGAAGTSSSLASSLLGQGSGGTPTGGALSSGNSNSGGSSFGSNFFNGNPDPAVTASVKDLQPTQNFFYSAGSTSGGSPLQGSGSSNNMDGNYALTQKNNSAAILGAGSVGNNNAKEQVGVLSLDPEDYFTRIGLEQSIFKKVSEAYRGWGQGGLIKKEG